MINLDMPSMIFSSETKEDTKMKIRLPIRNYNIMGNYLWLSTKIGISKRRAFNFVMDKIITRINGLKEKNLLYACEVILIKVIAQVITAYAMCFLNFQLASTMT